MVRTLLIRGMLIGLLAGLLVFAFARVFGEPQVDRAISSESAMGDDPPSIGEPDTIGLRTALYFGMLGLSLAAMIAAIAIRRGLERYQGPWNAALIAGAVYVLAVGIAAAALPAINEVPAEFPATVLWTFRVSSFGMQIVMWATLGLGFGIAAERALQAQPGTLRRVVYQS